MKAQDRSISHQNGNHRILKVPYHHLEPEAAVNKKKRHCGAGPKRHPGTCTD
jgi:hypothetical protein